MKWEPIETAPKDGTRFLAGRWWNYRWLCSVMRWSERTNSFRSYPGNVHSASPSPTHWMPLPEPPEDKP